MAKLGDIATYINGYAFKPSDWSTEGLPIIRIQDLTGSSYKTNKYNGDYDKKYEVNNGDILISWSASLGVFVWKNDRAVLNQHIFKVIFNKKVVDKDFFVYQVENILRKAQNSVHGATMKHLTKPVFDSLDFYLPLIEEQKRIAKQLKLINLLIDRRNDQIKKLDLLVKSRFVEMFGELKSNSKKWVIEPFDYFATIDGNMTTDFVKYANYPHIGIDSIEKNSGILKGYKTVKEDGVKSGKYIFNEEHIIYSKIRPNLNKVALPDFEGLCSADAYPILVKKDVCNRIYLVYVMRSSYFLDYILAFSSRTNMPKVNRAQVKGFSMPLPPLQLQNQFAAFVTQVDKSKLAIQQSLYELETLKKSLMQQYFG